MPSLMQIAVLDKISRNKALGAITLLACEQGIQITCEHRTQGLCVLCEEAVLSDTTSRGTLMRLLKKSFPSGVTVKEVGK